MSKPNTDAAIPQAPLPPIPVSAPLTTNELTVLLIKHYGLHEGFYELLVEFMIGSGNMGPTPDTVAPATIVSFSKVGLIKATESGPMSVDASKVNPARKRKASAKP